MRIRSILAATLAVAALGTVNQAEASTNGVKGHPTWTSHAHGRLILGAHRVVKRSVLPHCATEDSVGPCTWNIGHPVDGNGRGLAFWNGTRGRSHYVWATDPRHGRWHWVNSAWADAMAESGEPGATTRNWQACIIRIGDTTFIRCADGTVISS